MELSTLFETTKTAFASFQAQGKRCHYPDHLKENALTLLPHYSEQTLCSALGVTHVSLRSWLKDKNQRAKPPLTFMTLDIDTPEPLPKKNDNTVSLIVHLPHQLSLSLPSQSVKKAVEFVSALVKEFEPC